MRVLQKHFFLMAAILMTGTSALSQEKETLVTADSNTTTTVQTVDSSKGSKVKKIRVYDPRKAVFRSAVLPGWGQVYNRKYWKVPIVYGVLGTTAGVFFYNLTNYKDTRYAYKAKYNLSQPTATAADTAAFEKVKPKLQRYSLETLRYYRDEFRRDIDYSVIFFLLFWGLNVVDAAVDAHLKAFDVSPDLSLRIKPGHSQMAGTNGLSLVLTMR